MTPKGNLKNGGIDLTFYEHEATILSFDNIRGKLLQELGKPDLNITSRDMSLFTGRLQQFQEDALGLNAHKNINVPLRLPSKLFKVDSHGKLTTSHPLFQILLAAYSFMLHQGWTNNYDFITATRRTVVIDMIAYITEVLIEKNVIRKPRIAFAANVDDQNRKALAKLARSTGANIVSDVSKATHVLHGSMEDIDNGEEEWFRTLEKRDGRVLIHWWYYPDSYDTWLPESQQFMADPEEPPTHEGPWNITARWLQESVKYNEWMNEEDYEEISNDSPEPMEGVPEIRVANSRSRHQRMESDAGMSESTTAIGEDQMTEVEDVFLDEDKQPLVKVCDVERDRPQTGVKSRKNEFEPYSHGDLTNISCFTFDGLVRAKRKREESMDVDDEPKDMNQPTKDAYQEAKSYLSSQPVPKQIIIPTAASSWFDASKVHDIEKLSLPHFFEHEGDNSYEQEYIRYRDYMITTYQADSAEYLTVLACTKDLNGDLEDLMRIHSFLELWGLINYQVDPRTRPFETCLENEHDAGIMPFQYPEDEEKHDSAKTEEPPLKKVYRQMRTEIFDPKLAGMIKPRITTLASDDGGDPDDPDSRGTAICDSCKADCTDVRYQSLKIKNTQVCPDCFLEGRFSSTMSSGDFLRVEGNMDRPAPEEEWTPREQLLLLEGIEKYNDDWLLVSEHVGTRKQEQCIMQFLQAPIQDNIVKSLAELTEEEQTNKTIPFENAENPVMTLVAFLAGAVNPAVGAVAAQSALKVLLESPTEEQQRDSDEEEGSSHYSRDILEKATATGLASAIEQAHALARHEDAEIQRMIQIVLTTQLKKLDLKLQQYEELEQSLVNEQKELEKQRVMLVTSINAMKARAPPPPSSQSAAATPTTTASTPTTTN